MKWVMSSLVALVAAGLVGACASTPIPVQRMADAQAATRSADELGANRTPQGALHLRLAQDEIAQAKGLIDRGDNQRAALVLTRAKADADLARAEAQVTTAQSDAMKAQRKLQEARASGAGASTTTVTGATVPAAPPPPANPGGK